MNCFNGANIGTCATFRTDFGVNFINITFRNCFNGAFIDAGSASGAILINFVSHNFVILVPGRARQG